MQKEETSVFLREIVMTLAKHNYELKEKIGSGGFASVYKCKNIRYNEIFCVKVIEVPEGAKESLVMSFDSEFQTLVKIIHPNIITLFDHFRSEHCLFLILEYCPNGSCADLIVKNGGPLEVPKLIELFRIILQAINYIHSIGIAHRDIKPQNILIDVHHRPKLADFGLAEFYQADQKKAKYGGSLAYMAPELVLKKEFNAEAVDIWALGISFFQITTGTLPWVTPQVAKEIMAGFVFIPNEIDPQISQLLRKMLQAEPSRRPTSSQLLQLPIFNNDNTDQYQPTLTTMPLKQMSFIAPAISSFNSNKMTTSASIINHKSRRKMKNQVFSKKRVSLSYTFSEDETPEPNNVSDSFLK
ncbi:hypothetical protein M9Y10_011273 [Tritrichomonas musculus]|uniref:Protein kinase domain-containing protein n=1 Tax=Tritrichomonas musculus TaxID=1915356 RepID=A0ABR2IK34_9EUKA